jgi:hypothetical protein
MICGKHWIIISSQGIKSQYLKINQHTTLQTPTYISETRIFGKRDGNKSQMGKLKLFQPFQI